VVIREEVAIEVADEGAIRTEAVASTALMVIQEVAGNRIAAGGMRVLEEVKEEGIRTIGVVETKEVVTIPAMHNVERMRRQVLHLQMPTSTLP
jgi:hypothetical protein